MFKNLMNCFFNFFQRYAIPFLYLRLISCTEVVQVFDRSIWVTDNASKDRVESACDILGLVCRKLIAPIV